MVSGNKDLWYIKVLANGILYLYMCPLTDVACGVKWVIGMSTKPCTEFHPEKCQVLHISNKRNPLEYNYNIHGHILKEAETSKYLGINLNRTLSWNNHINTVAKKASNISAFLQRNLHQLPRKSKAQCYQTLVRPLMEYACTIWDPYNKENINKLKAVQRRSARFIYNDFKYTTSVTPMLNELNWAPLQERRVL
jgi:hypothetical protein